MSSFFARIAERITDHQARIDFKRLEDIEMTYKLMKRVIQKGSFKYQNTLLKLDVFLMADRITPEEYQELVELMGSESSG